MPVTKPAAPGEGAAPDRRTKLRKYAKRAGAVVIGLVALDLLATAATAVFAWGIFQK